jgi:hypothetical protein
LTVLGHDVTIIAIFIKVLILLTIIFLKFLVKFWRMRILTVFATSMMLTKFLRRLLLLIVLIERYQSKLAACMRISSCRDNCFVPNFTWRFLYIYLLETNNVRKLNLLSLISIQSQIIFKVKQYFLPSLEQLIEPYSFFFI